MSLKLENIVKRFGNRTVLDGFSYEFEENGVYAVVGESGVGKTTLLRIISGLDTDFTGTVSEGGAKNTSVAFQEYRLFPQLTALENLVFAVADKPDPETVSRAREALTALGFSEEDMQKRPSGLSGGMKQRVSLARAFLRPARILLLDEPTKELDAANVALVLSEIGRQAESRTVIIVTHRAEDIEALSAKIISL